MSYGGSEVVDVKDTLGQLKIRLAGKNDVLTYGVPVDMQDHLLPGMRVEVALGKNKQYSGIVERLHDERQDVYQVKPVRNILDEEPVVTEKQL
eukprot:gene15147-14946_t